MFALLCLLGKAQAQDNGLVAKSLVEKDRIILRWAPTDFDILLTGLQRGYTIERIEQGSGEQFEGNPTLVNYSFAPGVFRLEEALEDNNEAIAMYAAAVKPLLSKEADKLSKAEKAQIHAMLMLAASPIKPLAEMLGLWMDDTAIDTKKTYLYRIGIPNKNGNGRLHQTQITVDAGTPTKLMSWKTLTAVPQSKRRTVMLQWEAVALQNDYSGYWIERSDSKNFASKKVLNDLPYIFFRSQDEADKTTIEFVDSLPEQGTTYYYRVQGISHFGTLGKYSNVIEVRLNKVLTGNMWIDTAYHEGNERIFKGIYEPHPKEATADVYKYVLMRSDSMNHSYEQVDETTGGSYETTLAYTSPVSSGDQGYYKIGAISQDNDTTYSLFKYVFTLDQIPPEQPAALEATIDSSGVVKINWALNAETDIQGYRIFRSNALYEEFIEVTQHFALTPPFYDTLALDNLTSTAYYKMRAVDDNFNNSEFSETVEVIKPDTIAPVAAFINHYASAARGLEIGWINSTSDDVAGHQLWSKDDNGKQLLIASWSDSLQQFTDTLIEVGNARHYHIITTDKSGNTSSSESLRIAYETGERAAADSLQVNVNREAKAIELTWTSPDKKVFKTHLYRSKNGEAFKLVKTLKGDAIRSYADQNLQINNTYQYKIKVIYQSGHQSPFSQTVEAVY